MLSRTSASEHDRWPAGGSISWRSRRCTEVRLASIQRSRGYLLQDYDLNAYDAKITRYCCTRIIRRRWRGFVAHTRHLKDAKRDAAQVLFLQSAHRLPFSL